MQRRKLVLSSKKVLKAIISTQETLHCGKPLTGICSVIIHYAIYLHWRSMTIFLEESSMKSSSAILLPAAAAQTQFKPSALL